MNTKKILQSIVSLVIAFIMMFNCIPVYANWYHDMVQGSGGGSSGTKGQWSTKWNVEEFIRCSIWFFEGGIESGSNPIPIGYPTDVRNPKYTTLTYGTPQYFSDFIENNNTARWYTIKNGDFTPGEGDYYTWVMPNLPAGKTKEEFEANQGDTSLEFPILFTAGNGVNALEYFSNYAVKNELLASVQGNEFKSPEESGGCWQGIGDIESGIYNVGGGVTKSGQYIILLEPGIYCSTSGVSAAFTLRDLIELNKVNDILHNFVDPVKNCAVSLKITDGEMWKNSLGLTADVGIESLSSPIYEASQLELAKQKLGAGVITCSPSVGQIPVIHYYYDLSGGIDGGGAEEGGASLENITTVYTPILSENTPSFNHTATSSKKVAVQGNEYKAPLYSKPNEKSTKDYTLVMGYMALKDNIDGALDIKEDWSLKFYDTLDVAQIPQKCITYTNSKISSEENVKVWNLSKHLVSSTEKNSEIAGISGKLVQQDGDSLKALYGNSVGKYQGVFLYVLMPDTGDGEVDPPGGKGTIPKKPDPGKNEEVLKVPTNVTKMYYESASASNPKKM